MSEDVGLPKATILNLIKEFLPADTRISNEANEVILKMSSEFVNHLSSISNDICLEGGKKTISQSHVADAMKKLKVDSYLAKIMNVEDSKELEGMTEKKKREMLNSSLNVTRKKKKGLTKEEEEELRKKQALLFQQDQQLEMLPSEMQKSYSTPVVSTSNDQQDNGPVYQPTDAKFYDGSITQVLTNPAINTAMQNQNVAQIQYPNSQPVDGQQNSLKVKSESKEEVDEEVICTTKPRPADQQNETVGRPEGGLAVSHQVSVGDIQSAPNPESDAAQQQHNQALINQYSLAKAKSKQALIEDEDEDFE